MKLAIFVLMLLLASCNLPKDSNSPQAPSPGIKELGYLLKDSSLDKVDGYFFGDPIVVNQQFLVNSFKLNKNKLSLDLLSKDSVHNEHCVADAEITAEEKTAIVEVARNIALCTIPIDDTSECVSIAGTGFYIDDSISVHPTYGEWLCRVKFACDFNDYQKLREAFQTIFRNKDLACKG